MFETLPVAGGIQSALLLKRAAGDRGLRPVERAAFLIGQPIQSVVAVKFIAAREHAGLSPRAIGRSIIAVLDLSECRAALLPQAVVDSPRAIESLVDVARVRIIRAAVQSPADPRLD